MRIRIFAIVCAAVICGNLLTSVLTPRSASASTWSISESAERMAKALERIATALEKPDPPKLP